MVDKAAVADLAGQVDGASLCSGQERMQIGHVLLDIARRSNLRTMSRAAKTMSTSHQRLFRLRFTI